ncbi:hypothetical protein [Pseudomonas sp.]|uniref:hypothetical protein n=1 Tax=Pseudomonas sp. TaxID=306 RepID=UPI0025890F34|nr:hypothetical protein [Pseudomonas sp.]
MIDLTYLRAELSKAYQENQKTVLVDRAELQSVIDRLHRFQEHGDQVPKLFGFIISDDLRNMRRGSHMFAKVKRRNTGRFDCPIYFMDMPKADPNPVPDDVYYNAEEDNFYSEITNYSMGGAFWQTWRRRKADFPQRRMTEMERQTLDDLEDCMPDLSAPAPTHFSGIGAVGDIDWFDEGSGSKARRRAASLGLSIPAEKT